MSEIKFSFYVERDAESGSPLPVRKWTRDASDAASGAVECANRTGECVILRAETPWRVDCEGIECPVELIEVEPGRSEASVLSEIGERIARAGERGSRED